MPSAPKVPIWSHVETKGRSRPPPPPTHTHNEVQQCGASHGEALVAHQPTVWFDAASFLGFSFLKKAFLVLNRHTR